jgi:hypothetical protein
MSNKMKFCCEDMMYAVEGGHIPNEPSVILYSPSERSFGLVIGDDSGNQWLLVYCPFCGEKLPTDLCDEYFDAIRDPETGRVLEPLPEEFQTDEWWKKRGL